MKYEKIILTPIQKTWLKEHYPDTKNADLARHLGIGLTTLYNFSVEFGLKKSPGFLNKIHKLGGRKIGKLPRTEQWVNKYVDTMRKIRRREHARLVFGLPQKTKFHLVRQSRSRVNTRFSLKKKGYILDDEKRIAYYDKDTKRSHRMEKFNQWYTYVPVNDDLEKVNGVNATTKMAI